jgi:hypothetical protein
LRCSIALVDVNDLRTCRRIAVDRRAGEERGDQSRQAVSDRVDDVKPFPSSRDLRRPEEEASKKEEDGNDEAYHRLRDLDVGHDRANKHGDADERRDEDEANEIVEKEGSSVGRETAHEIDDGYRCQTHGDNIGDLVDNAADTVRRGAVEVAHLFAVEDWPLLDQDGHQRVHVEKTDEGCRHEDD